MLDSLAKKGVALASPKGPRGRLSIFIFHRVKDVVDPLFVEDDESAGRFDQVLGWIGRWFQVLPLGEAVQELAQGRLRERAACITFDDGYADNLHNAAPILQAHGMHATFFIATGFLDGSVMWNDRIIESVRDTSLRHIEVEGLGLGTIPVGSVAEKRAALASLLPALKHRQPDERQAAVDQVVESCGTREPAGLMMTPDQVRELRARGMGIGAHTVSHPILARCDEETGRKEIGDSRDYLQDLLGERIGLFAYPNGRRQSDYTQLHADMVRDLGFDAAVTTNPGASRFGDDVFQLNRFTPWDRQRLKFYLRLMRNLA